MSETEFSLALIAALQKDARKSISDLAGELGASRATVKNHLDRLIASGEIIGFTTVLKDDIAGPPIRAITMLGIEGKQMERVIRAVANIPEVRAVHTTNGRWDLVLEIAANDLTEFDATLGRIRLIEGVSQTETNLLLKTKKHRLPV